jgi:hypothetical protein
VGVALLTRPDTVVQPDNIIHGIKRLLVPPGADLEKNLGGAPQQLSKVKSEAYMVV